MKRGLKNFNPLMLLIALSMAFVLADAQPLYEFRADQAAEDFGLMQKGTASDNMDYGSAETVALVVAEPQKDMKVGGQCPWISQTNCQPQTTCQSQTTCQPTTCQSQTTCQPQTTCQSQTTCTSSYTCQCTCVATCQYACNQQTCWNTCNQDTCWNTCNQKTCGRTCNQYTCFRTCKICVTSGQTCNTCSVPPRVTVNACDTGRYPHHW